MIAEVRSVLDIHLGKLEGVTESFIRALLDDWKEAETLGFSKLSSRSDIRRVWFFGQLKPRFENRIIPKCRFTGRKHRVSTAENSTDIAGQCS